MAKELVRPDSYKYRVAKEKFPDIDVFYSHYYSGDYYNTDYTTFYDEKGNELFTVNHGNYG